MTKPIKSVLWLDDPQAPSPELPNILISKGLLLSTGPCSDKGMEMLRENRFDVVFIQLTPDLEHKSLLRQISDLEMSVPVIAIARDPSVTEAVSVMQAGAVAYIEPPLTANSITSALDKAAVARESVSGQAGLHHYHASGTKRGYAKIIGKSKAISHVFTLIKKLCDTDTTVLIQGESGTGKELIAQALHYEGERRKGPFVSVNCGAIPEELLESELFGHEKGAFTHAIRTRIGRFELAHGGTVFLDEIAEMSPMLQVKILRVLQDHQFERIGSTKTITSDFRVIAATNRELEQEVKKGNFREDLYYRLNVVMIKAPPLRDRISDIPLLLEIFIEKFNRSRKKSISEIGSDIMPYMLKYSWPGNVRELENTAERMVILASGRRLTVEDLPSRLLESEPVKSGEIQEIPAEGFYMSEVVAEFEKKIIIQALDQTNCVKNRAAKLLHVNRTTLLEKMKRHNLVAPPGKV